MKISAPIIMLLIAWFFAILAGFTLIAFGEIFAPAWASSFISFIAAFTAYILPEIKIEFEN